MLKPRAPRGLKPAGSRLWRDLTSKYEFRPDELAVLERACRAADRIELMETELGADVTALGSTGQVVVHPLIPEIRSHSALVASLMRQLRIPDAPAGVGAGPNQQRDAAQSRWAAAHGTGA